MAIKTECAVFYLCDRKKCKKCKEYMKECKRTSDITHAMNKGKLTSRKFTCFEKSNGELFFEEDEE